ncbi:dehydrodolichyl diphosphate synthase complex subunit NUS1 [Drosophila obscura]|uniref:dehydrodolichyl diphosphate synthase complex subunit NUS1 n=1 Tax=Drosophila obscura TaxID=7282 RepID=UPI000BA01288|nr:dehydrodolichyl diphosphate synthase complex subunit NUS1 [Drosophila obscura]XP_022226529.1 dehydrodolichyl diphosphate synthase complex subunit NUS1 [Drosophila obscura]
MIEVICILLGKLLLLLVGAYELVRRLHQQFHALVRGSYDFCRGKDARERHERRLLADCKASLTKVPQHLVLIIAPDDYYVDAGRLNSIFGYALAIGIKHVSVYDRREKKHGYVELDALCQPREDSNGRCYSWLAGPVHHKTNGHTNGHKKNGYANGVNGTHLPQLQVYRIRPADCHALIADVCRDLYAIRETPLVQGLLQKRESLTEEITLRLAQRLDYEAPDPDLGIIFAHQTCTYGLMPWHVRFTEFHTHPSDRYFNVESFTKVLYRYSRCEQRWGT